MALPAGMSSCAMCVDYMIGTAWVTVLDNLSVIEPPTQTRMTGEGYVFGEDIALTTVGKREPVEVTARGIWAEGTADPFYIFMTTFETACGGKLALRWSPAGCVSTHDSFFTSTTVSELISLTYPGGDAASADVLMYELVVRTPSITRAAWA